MSKITNNIRPTTDKVKQALFTKLQFNEFENVLDLFCGSGALGIEAISRGAKNVVFVDNNYNSVKLTKSNLKSISADAIVIQSSYDKALVNFNTPFDLILVDPPYASGVYENVLSLIKQNSLLSEDGIIVCEHGAEYDIKSDYFELFDCKKYGTIKLSYFKNK